MIKIISTLGEFMTQATTLLSLNMNSNHRGDLGEGGGGGAATPLLEKQNIKKFKKD